MLSWAIAGVMALAYYYERGRRASAEEELRKKVQRSSHIMAHAVRLEKFLDAAEAKIRTYKSADHRRKISTFLRQLKDEQHIIHISNQ